MWNRDIVLEILNGIWAVLDFALLAWFTYYIYAQVKEIENYVWYHSLKYWWNEGLPPQINAAVAIYVFTTGDAIVRTYIWYWRHQTNLGHDEHLLSIVPVLFGGVIALIGLLCKIRVFTIYRIGNKAWILSILLALSIIALLLYTAPKSVHKLVPICMCDYEQPVRFLVGPKDSS